MIIMKSIKDYNGTNIQLYFYCTKLNDLKKLAQVSVYNWSSQWLSITLIQYRNTEKHNSSKQRLMIFVVNGLISIF